MDYEPTMCEHVNKVYGHVYRMLKSHWRGGSMQGVTVIVPLYNEELLLNRCVESIVNQTYEKLEILLIDDGSTDNGSALCQKWVKKDARVQVVHKENEGLGPTRNLGIAMAKNDIIAFIDADDWLDERFVELLLNKMNQTDAELAVCDIFYWDSKKSERELSKIRFKRDVTDAKSEPSVMNRVRTFAWGKLWKKELFTDDLLFPAWTFEDIASIPLLAYKAKKIGYVNQGLYHYWRNQSDSLSAQGENISDIGKSLHLLWKRAAAYPLSDKQRLEIKKIMLAQVRMAYRKWHGNETYCESLKRLSNSLASYYPCFQDYEKMTFAKTGDVRFDKALGLVAYSEEQIIEKGSLRFDLNQFSIPQKEEELWEIAEYIMNEI